jgi:hypothetical protein
VKTNNKGKKGKIINKRSIKMGKLGKEITKW